MIARPPSGLPRLPRHAPGLRIGLLGGSFNPPHAAHRLVSETALRRLGLDRVWWLVTPGNPLKDNAGLPPLKARIEAARRVAAHPRIDVTGFEAELGSIYTVDVLAWLSRRCRGVQFVWLMGADNLAGFHRWRRWREIAALTPIAVIDRPGATLRAASAPAARALAAFRLAENDARLLPGHKTPAWVFLHGPRSPLSSTALRARGLGLPNR
ncbi:nicotinate-nucleotide adenylyltransferase [Alsobacter sp. SYSU M60028]|uniref:Probable nicotinate-nucleotide adenylyltransferase n=1 Tax=Alsobacter ponti TaxID=2962936 RepID=A0ABT1LKC0_9HYPH|nr:nicotinate-nucleotide adenylyltransferase [Alsobacter ponti]MCP8940698.1 nicotinate-nucleotide adenylyltransferase [Alsobacter ponti]